MRITMEAFVVEHHDDDAVSFTVTAFSRPATRLARIAGPLGRITQRRITLPPLVAGVSMSEGEPRHGGTGVELKLLKR
jgi:hypothetical protein